MAWKDKGNCGRILAPLQSPNLPQCPALLKPSALLHLADFKVLPCRLPNQHNHKHCPFYHSHKDKRRCTSYSPDLCATAEACSLGETCPKAHNRVEQLYHPEKYKTKFCTQYPEKLEGCDYGQFCSFAHSDSEIKVRLIHHNKRTAEFYLYQFKTIWCPFITTHDKALCVYAHNWQDYRRNPNLHDYEAQPCAKWKAGTFISSYAQGGCEDMTDCRKCHGWKELEYHPGEYRMKLCTAGSACTRQPDCPYYHSLKERRTDSSISPPPGFDCTEDKENLSTPALLPKPDLPHDEDMDLFRDIAAFVGQGPVHSPDLSIYRSLLEPSPLTVSFSIDCMGIPSRLVCPLTGLLMHDPVVYPEDGRTYECSALLEVMEKRGERTELKRDEAAWREIEDLTRDWM